MGFFLLARGQTQRGLLMYTMAGDPPRNSVIRKNASGGGRWGASQITKGLQTQRGGHSVQSWWASDVPALAAARRASPGAGLLRGLEECGQVARSRQRPLSGSGRAGEGTEKSLGICQCVSFSKLPINLSSLMCKPSPESPPPLSVSFSRSLWGDQLIIMS